MSDNNEKNLQEMEAYSKKVQEVYEKYKSELEAALKDPALMSEVMDKVNAEVGPKPQCMVDLESRTEEQADEAQKMIEEAAKLTGNQWVCSCGAVSVGKFCPQCGQPKPEKPDDGSWVCSCGAVSVGKFCPQCGKPKPEKPDDGSWICSCGARSVGKFCPQCGKPKA